jgi:hypothetical protein
MSKQILFIVKISAFFVFFGRAYQLFYFGAPYRAIFWDETLMSPIVEDVFRKTWYNYATSDGVDTFLTIFTRFNGFLLLTAGLISLFWSSIKAVRLKKILLKFGLFSLVFLGICISKDNRNDSFQFFEMCLQFCVPLVLLFQNKFESLPIKNLNFWFKIAIALTFIPHGLYAMGVIYLPGHFIDMTIQLLSVNESQAKNILFLVGFLDVLFSILIFIPTKFNKYILGYLAFWGFVTAFARIVAGFNIDFIKSSIHNLSFLTIYRLPHGLIPLAVLIIENNFNKNKLNKNKRNNNETKTSFKSILSLNNF